jgi:antitoxin component HigA of HigAB toxin-antitoxin module
MPIRERRLACEAEYESALAEIETLMRSANGTPEGCRLVDLVELVEAFEASRWPMETPAE